MEQYINLPKKVKVFNSVKDLSNTIRYVSKLICDDRHITTIGKIHLVECAVNDCIEMFFTLTDEAINELRNKQNK